jgi:dTMP kinase
VTFEGTEGSGKSTQLKLLTERLRTEGYCVVENQEPGATAIGKQIRRIFLDPENHEMASMTELLLVFASRAQAAAEIVVPALDAGHIVVSDRFTDSTLAYQGAARGIGFTAVRRAHELALGALWPQVTICITVDLAEGLQRAHQRNQSAVVAESRLDEQSLDFHRRVLEGYRQIALSEPQRFRMIDGSGSMEAVAERVWREVQALLPQRV